MNTPLVVIPIFNEKKTLQSVLRELYRYYSGEVLLIDDGSSDDAISKVKPFFSGSTTLITHSRNLGYGASLRSGFEYAKNGDYDCLVTIDCDWQHEPSYIPKFLEQIREVDVISGSRYLKQESDLSKAPEDRRRVNHEITQIINDATGFSLTDSFCGFKAYSRKAIETLAFNQNGYGSPIEIWAQIYMRKLSFKEIAVPLIYLDAKRSFGGELDSAEIRKKYYLTIWEEALSQKNISIG